MSEAQPLLDGVAMSAPQIEDADIEAVTEALRSGTLGLGPRAEAFEVACAVVAGVRHGVAVSSGTAGLHLIVRALGIGAGDRVATPSFTFAASVNAFMYEGAEPVFVDVEPDTGNIDPAALDAVGGDVSAAMVVDVFGHPATWDGLTEVVTRHDMRAIDDSCEAIGATWRGRRCGSFGDAGAFAFYPNKQITTGEGGMIVTDDEGLARRCRSLRNQGRGAMGSWLDHEALGFNYRMDELSAALGVAQISRLDAFLEARATVARRYTERLAGLDAVRSPVVRPGVRMSWFVYVIRLDPVVDRDRVLRSLADRGVPSRTYFPAVHLQPYIRERFATREGSLPVTEDLARRSLALPFHNRLTEAQVERVVEALRGAIDEQASLRR